MPQVQHVFSARITRRRAFIFRTVVIIIRDELFYYFRLGRRWGFFPFFLFPFLPPPPPPPLLLLLKLITPMPRGDIIITRPVRVCRLHARVGVSACCAVARVCVSSQPLSIEEISWISSPYKYV